VYCRCQEARAVVGSCKIEGKCIVMHIEHVGSYHCATYKTPVINTSIPNEGINFGIIVNLLENLTDFLMTLLDIRGG
jgi:hypothetical protein